MDPAHVSELLFGILLTIVGGIAGWALKTTLNNSERITRLEEKINEGNRRFDAINATCEKLNQGILDWMSKRNKRLP